MQLGLVVPVFNETARLAEYVPQLLAYIDERRGSELIFVDDGSSDGTPEMLDELVGDTRVPALVLRRPHQGKGAAIVAGLNESRSELRAFCDLDLSTPLTDLDRLIDVAGRAEVLAIGSRDLSGSVLVKPESKTRESLGRLYNRLVQATVTPGIVDTQCGAKAARAEVWRRLLPLCRQQGFAWDAELVAVALALGIAVQEVAIAWSHDPRSQVHVLRDGLAMVRETPRIWHAARQANQLRLAEEDRRSAAVERPEVFDDASAAQMLAVDRTHWWFRSKAAYVATALARTHGPPRDRGWLADVGGGSGSVSAMIGWPTDRLLVVEGNPQLVSSARNHLGLTAVRGYVGHLPVPDASIDVVALLDVIEHLEDPGDALLEARRVLEPRGRLVVNVPAHGWLWSEADKALGHKRRYTKAMLRSAVGEAGFKVELVTHVFSWLVPPVWFVRRLARPSQAELGLDRTSWPVNVASLVLTALERAAIGRVSLPFGTSVLCVARPVDRVA